MRALLVGLWLLLAPLGVPAGPQEPPLLDLSGEWYVLLHYRDGNSPDPDGVRFRDFGWSIQQGEGEIVFRTYPYVVFEEELEQLRKGYMRAAERWDPDPATMARLREELPVSPRAATSERLLGSRAVGFRSPSSGPGGVNTLTFTRDWRVRFEPGVVRVEIEDALGGHQGFEEMHETTVYEIQERTGPGELRGVYREGKREGTFRMLRARARRLVD